MSAHRPLHARPWAAVASVATLALTLSACGNGGGSNDGDGNAAGGSLTIGTTDKITSLDPAGSYDNGSFAVMNQIYPFLLNTPLGSPDVEPDIAASAEFTSPTEYTVTLKPGLKWANGHDLTSSDVKFTFDRQVAIADDNGPSSLLWNLDSVDAPDDTTVVFHLKSGNDQTFPQVLSSPVGPIVDEEVFDADAVTPDQTIVDGKAFAGQYTITSYTMNELVSYAAYDGYQACSVRRRRPRSTSSTSRTPRTSSWRSSRAASTWRTARCRPPTSSPWRATTTSRWSTAPAARSATSSSTSTRCPTAPRRRRPTPPSARRAAGRRGPHRPRHHRRPGLQGTYTPLYSYVPDGLTGATESLKDLYGDGKGGPDAAKAEKTLSDAGVETPVVLNLQYSNDHYGPSSGDEYALIKDQLEATGLFTVNLQTTEWVQYSKDRSSDVYPAYQLGCSRTTRTPTTT